MGEIELYLCRECGSVSGSTPVGGCPNCGNAEGPEYEVRSLEPDVESVTRQKSWYKLIRLDGGIYD